jgi:hypothetical protein
VGARRRVLGSGRRYGATGGRCGRGTSNGCRRRPRWPGPTP